jgi:hypothetical protein
MYMDDRALDENGPNLARKDNYSIATRWMTRCYRSSFAIGLRHPSSSYK